MSETPLQKELQRIEKDYGRGSVIRPSNQHTDVISTRSLKLDIATGIGGLPRGKIVEIMGWESSGKSTTTMQVIAEAQSKGLECLLVDGENSFDERYARKLGINTDKLLYEQLDEHGAERCYDIAERLIRTGGLGVVVFDSQTSLLPKKALTEENGTVVMGLCARMMSTAVPKILNAAAIGNTLVIYISQFREKIGVMFGNPTTTSGGNALKFYAHMRIEMSKSILRDGKEGKGEAYANKTTAKVIKNKLSPPFKTAEFRINFGEGVDRILEILDLATDFEIVQLNGSWYSYNNDRLGHGEANVLTLMRDNEELTKELEKKVVEKAYQK
jgi:recombination protein RecA